MITKRAARPAGVALAAALLMSAFSAGQPANAREPGKAGATARLLSCNGWQAIASPSLGASQLNAAAATSASDAWAVGFRDTGGAIRTLIEHWNGKKWSIVTSPNPAPSGIHTTDTLGGVVAISKTNAWAFGFYEKQTTSFRTLIEHWNGIKWSVVPSPNSGSGENTLAAGFARSASDVWAVGYRNDPDHRRTLTERWNGSKWSIVPSPSVGSGDNFLFGIAAAPGGPVWAVGSDSVSFGRTLALRWNGHAWAVGKTANTGDGDRFLQAVAAPARRYALAVGSYLRGNQVRTLAERWTGSGWSIVPSASPAANFNSLQAVAGTGTASAWAVGAKRTAFGAPFGTLAEHWNGKSWTAVASPSPGSGDDWLFGLTAVPRGGGFWAVGTAGDNTLIEHHC